MTPMREAVAMALRTLDDLGLKAQADPQLLDLPGVWVTPSAVSWPTLAHARALIALDVVLISRNLGVNTDIDTLDTLMIEVGHALNIRDWQADVITLPNHSPDPLPCLKGTTTIEWSN